MCFAGGGSSQATEIDPSIQAQQEADKAKADAKTTEMKESAIQSSVAANKPLVASSSPSMTSMPTQSDANPFSIESNTLAKSSIPTSLNIVAMSSNRMSCP